MSSFRTPHSVLREAVGAYVSGAWVPGARSVATVSLSGQPVTMGQDMQSLPEGRHKSDYRKFYSASALVTTQDGEGAQPDIVVDQGYGYELVTADAHQSNVVSHFKYIGVKVFKFTSAGDWTSGALKRP